MRPVKSILFFVLIYCNTILVSAQNIIVNDSLTAQQLVENVLINSPCANVSNFTVKGDDFSHGQQSYGYFDAGNSSFPFITGIVLSTSRAKRTEGPNIDLIDEGSTSWPGDVDLEQALNIDVSINATSLEFDFTPLASQISFDYIFASEEYLGDVCNYSDGFAFLLKEADTTNPYRNLAIIPNTTIPVKVTTVHPDISSDCPAKNSSYFEGFNGDTSPINLNGQTVVMTAKATVVPGTKYHIKLVIADEKNIRYDSAIFLGGGSFKVGTDLGPDKLISTSNPVCFGETYTLDATEGPNDTYKWFENNVEIPEETDSKYIVKHSGVYKVEVALNGTTCKATGEVTIEYLPALNPTPATIVQCDDNNDGLTIFKLSKADNLITANDSSLLTPVYYENTTDTSPIANPNTYQTAAPKTIYARISNDNGCFSFVEVNLQISNNPISTLDPILTCDDDDKQDGLYHFDLNTEATPQVLTGLPNGLVVEYYLNSSDAISQKNPLSNIFKNTTPNQEIIYARIVNGPDCYGITPITLVVNTFDPPNFQDKTASMCDGSSVNISVNIGFSAYLWDTGATSNTITVTAPGNYSVTVTDLNGCTKTKKFTVIASGIATISGATINDFAGNDNSVLIDFSGLGNYEFSLDGTFFQDNPLFTGIAPGKYFAFARDKNGCGLSAPYTIYVLDYPRYFTPNGDGFNDVWEIKNLGLLANFTLTIFDRYGKLLKQLTTTNSTWNGTFNGHLLPATDYWFTLAVENGKTIKGHFSLKR